jgi:hypothetical protein
MTWNGSVQVRRYRRALVNIALNIRVSLAVELVVIFVKVLWSVQCFKGYFPTITIAEFEQPLVVNMGWRRGCASMGDAFFVCFTVFYHSGFKGVVNMGHLYWYSVLMNCY